MGSEGLLCPLCCGEVYATRAALRAHLGEALHGLRCPACEQQMPSLSELCQHLETEDCGRDDTSQPEKSVTSFSVEIPMPMLHNETDLNAPRPMQVVAQNHNFQEIMKMEDLKQESKPKLTFVDCNDSPLGVMEGNESHILIVGSDSDGLLGSQSVITTQNDDGTISFTPIESEGPEGRDVSMSEGGDVGDEGDAEVEGELYSCNTCGVSFTSVLQHIQTYHSQQDVVVEVAESESENLAEEIPMGVVMKRVITASGDIIETSAYAPTNAEDGNRSLVEEECVDKDGRTYTRRFVKIDKFWNDAANPPPSESSRKINEIMEFDTLRGCHVKVFSCGRCLMKCKTRDELDGHVCKSHGEYLCPHCPVTYSSAKSLCAHMKVHKTSINKLPVDEASARPSLISFKCDDCDTEFPSNKSLRLHRRMHDPVKSRPMEGPIAYNGADRAEREASGGGGGGGEGGEDTYHCPVCDKWIHEGYRKIHNEFHSTSGVEQHHCEICNRKFLSQDYLLMHMNVHNHDKVNVIKSDKSLPYSCLYCSRRFARPHEKVKHERIHTGEKPHSCEICGKSFRVSYCLTLHMRTHTGARPYACAHCGKRFKAHSVYNHHLLTHSEVRAYKCPYCPKAFKTSVQLAGHKNSHTKPFSCTHCNRPFASLYAVRVHTETHRRQNNLKFSCKLCGASYARAFALKDHMRTAHDSTDTAPDYSGGIPEAIFETDAALAIMPKKENNSLGVEDLEDSRNEEILP